MSRAQQRRPSRPKRRSSFDSLLAEFSKHAPAFVAHLKANQDAYIQCVKYPRRIRACFATSNAVEAVNGQLEKLRRNSGGYFQSQDSLSTKLGITFDILESTSWKRPSGNFAAAVADLQRLHASRFEDE